MSPILLKTFIDYHRSTNGKFIPIVWAFPGLVYGFNYSILKFIDEMRKALKQDKAYIVFYSWKTSFNMPFVTALQKLTDSDKGVYKSIELIYAMDTYENSGLVDVSQSLLKDLGIKKNYEGKDTIAFHSTHFKRLVYFYSHYKTFNFLHSRFNLSDEHTSLPFVFRMTPKFEMADHRWINSSGLKTLLLLFEYAEKHLSLDDLDLINHPYDILYTVDSGSSYYNDMLYASSSETLVNIFGTSDDVFYSKLLSFYENHLDRYPGSLHTDRDFQIFGQNRNILPLEGSTIMKHFADKSKHPVVNVSCKWLGAFTESVMNIKTPWYSIGGTQITPPKELESDKLLKQYLNYELYGRKFITTKLQTEI